MTSKVPLRDVTPFMQALRNFLLGRQLTSQLRAADEIAARTQPPPKLPEGPYHKLSANYYYQHDARRALPPPLLLAENTKQALHITSAAAEPKNSAVAIKKPRTPGQVYHWD